MKLADTRILLTGASGGIGRATAVALAGRGARLLLAGRDAAALAATAEATGRPERCAVLPGDLSSREGCAATAAAACEPFGGVDLLINNAGSQSVGRFETEDPVALERMVQTNVLAPMLLTRLLLPAMRARGHGGICCIGSAFGSIGFACYASYSGSKFAMRGFCEALRRELAGSGVRVLYVAPRATATRLTDAAMARELGMTVDSPERVAGAVVDALEHDRAETYIGFPERIAVRLNGLFPRLFDAVTRKQSRHMLQHTQAKEAH